MSIRGYRIVRLVGRGTIGAVYEAVEESLGRTVALRLIDRDHFTDAAQLARFDEQQRLAASVHHPHIVPTFGAGEWEGGRFIAMRFIRGPSLAELQNQDAPPPVHSLRPIADALGAAHAVGLVHGRVNAASILLDAEGTPFLANLGLGREGDPQADLAALAELEHRLLREARTRAGLGRRLAAGLAALGLGAGLLLLVSGNDDEGGPSGLPPPEPVAGTVALGSELDAGPAATIGCDADPGPNTPACTLAQTELGGRSVTVTRPGAIRGWAVRGATGDLRLEIVREFDDRSFVPAFSQLERVTAPGPKAFAASVRILPGDRIGVMLAPGAVIGVRPDAEGSAMLRWEGRLPTAASRAQPATPLSGELLLRVDIDLGARPNLPRQLRGARAVAAPAGRRLRELNVALSPGRSAVVALVELPRGIALDLFRRGRRIRRINVPDADPQGELLSLAGGCGGAGGRGFCLRWSNAREDPPVDHEYRVGRGGRIRVIGSSV